MTDWNGGSLTVFWQDTLPSAGVSRMLRQRYRQLVSYALNRVYSQFRSCAYRTFNSCAERRFCRLRNRHSFLAPLFYPRVWSQQLMLDKLGA